MMSSFVGFLILLIVFIRPLFCGMAEPSSNWLILIILSSAFGIYLIRRKEAFSTPLDTPLFFFGLSLLTSLILSKGKGFEIASQFLACFLVFHLVVSCQPKEKTIRTVLLSSGILVSLYAIYQRFWGLSETRAFIEIHQLGGEFIHRASGRVFSTFMYPNSLAGYLVLILPLSISKKTWPITLLYLYALYLSGSRGGFVSLFLVLFVFLWMKAKRMAILWSIISLILFIHFLTPIPGSVKARFDYWKTSLVIIKEHPLGVGLSEFGNSYIKYKPPLTEETRNAHNGFLQIGVEAGVFGLLSYFWLTLCFLQKGWKVAKEKNELLPYYLGGFSFFIHSSLDFDLYIPGISLLLFLFLGMVFQPEKKDVPTSRLSLVFVLLLIPLIFYSNQMRLSYKYIEEGWSSLFVKDYEKALAGFTKASTLNPFNGEILFEQGRIYEYLKKREEADGFYREAILRNPNVASYHFQFALFLIRKGGYQKEIIQHLKIASSLYPTKPIYKAVLEWQISLLKNP
ncbi:O-antigen ligase family protein [bacterium]|nr:O-antigen ligase family protein [bacterium]MBU1599363.1 O-antigen ligase family protein [bacterium]